MRTHRIVSILSRLLLAWCLAFGAHALAAEAPAAGASGVAQAAPGPDARRDWAESNAYKLGPGDVLSIYVYGEDDLKREKMLLSGSGVISYPFGDVHATGLTITELKHAIEAGLKQGYLVNPRVSVTIDQYRPFFIYGEVQHPGGYPFQPGLNVRKAVSLAGGFTERASQDKIFVVREGDTQNVKHKIDLNGDIRPGDTVTVEESFF